VARDAAVEPRGEQVQRPAGSPERQQPEHDKPDREDDRIQGILESAWDGADYGYCLKAVFF